MLMLDPRATDTVSNVELILGEVRKHPGNPLFGEDYFSDPPRAWETRFDNVYPSIVRDPKSHAYRAWYFSFLTDSDMADVPLDQRGSRNYGSPEREDGLLYAESLDGITWDKPNLGLIEFKGSTANNIVMSTESHGIHAGGVLLDDHDADPDRRYKAVFRSRRARTMAVAFSADGLEWSEPVPWPEHSAVGDTHTNGFWDPSRNCYVIVTRGWTESTPEDLYRGERTVLRCESNDFINWSEPREVLRGDGPHDQVYSMPIARYGDIYVGLPAIFHKGTPGADDWDLVDTELAVSNDSFDWRRVAPGRPLIPRGEGTYPSGAYDCGCIYAAAPIVDDNEIRIYYGGSNGTHNGFRESSLNLATLPLDRWAGYVAADGIGTIVTSPVTIRDEVTLNLTTSGGGWARIEVHDVHDVPDERSRRCDSVQIFGDGLRIPVRWRQGELPRDGRAFRLSIELQDAALYAVNGVSRAMT